MVFKKLLLGLTLTAALSAASPAFAAAPVITANNTVSYIDPALTPTRYVSYQGLNVAVYESAGTKGPGILMVHGNTSSANSYTQVFRSKYASKHKVVLMDMPGYGASDNAAASQYSISFQIGAIAAVAAATGTDHGVLVGWSLGAVYGVQATQLLPHLRGLFLFGDAVTNFDPTLPPPFLSPSQSYAGAAVGYGTVANLSPIQVVDYVNFFFSLDFGRIPRYMLADGLRTDPNTRAAIANIVTGADPLPDPMPILENATFKLALVNGADDAFVNNDRYAAIEGRFPTLFRHKTIFIQNAGHAIQMEATDRFIGILKSFVDSL